jgi:hypothetical protein
MLPPSKVKINAENLPLKRSTFLSVSAHNATAMAEIILKNPPKKFDFCRNIDTLLALQQQLTLYMYTCMSDGLRREKDPSMFILTMTLILKLFKNG